MADDYETFEEKSGELTEQKKRDNVIRLAFSGNEDLFNEFCDWIKVTVPEGTTAVLRGSSVSGHRWEDGAPFDSKGPGTSDLDLTLVGDEILSYYSLLDGFYLPAIHSKPLSDKDPEIAPDLVRLRDKLMSLVNRPVNIQASRDFIMYLRGDLMGQPYFTLFGRVGG